VSLAWGLPLAFAGLAALLVPLLLHLDRRRSVQLLRFAALRWVRAQARPRRTWRLVEWLLLALRLLLVAVLVTWLAQPWLQGRHHPPRHWILVAPGAAALPEAEAGAHAAWLGPDFPSLDTPAPAPGDTSVASLLREFDARLAREDTLEVRVPTVLRGLDAAAIELSREVRWVVAGDSAPPERSAPAKRRLALRYATASEPALRPVRAALSAWRAAPELAVEIDEARFDQPVPEDAEAVLRIGSPATGAALASGPQDGAANASEPARAADAARARAATLAPRGEAKVRRELDAASFDPALLQSADFPRWLHRALFGDPPPPDRAFAAQIAPSATAASTAPPAEALRPWLAWLAAGLFLLERVLANGRRLVART
jgi:hypothetical protein